MGTYTKAQLETELTRIKNAVASCRTAIYNKGVTSIPSNVTLAQLPTYVNMIQCTHPDIPCSYIGNSETVSSSRGDVYFDTGLKGGNNVSFDAVFCKSVSGSDGMLFGADESHFFIPLHARDYLFWYTNTPAGRTNWKQSGANTSYVNKFVHYSSATNREGSSSYGVTVGSSWYTNGAIGTNSVSRTTSNIYLFARNKAGTIDCKAPLGSKLRYICFFEDGNLVRFFIPVLHWVNNAYTPCLYDKVNDTYHYNLGSGTPVYATLNSYLYDYFYATANHTDIGFLSDYSIESQSNRLHTKGTLSATGYENVNEQYLLCLKVDGSNKFGLFSKCAGVANNGRAGMKWRNNSSTWQNIFYNVAADVPFKLSEYMNTNTVFYGNGTKYTNSTYQYSSSVVGKKMTIFGSGFVAKDNRCYYAIMSDINRTNSYVYIPILDREDNKHYMFDLCNLAQKGWTGTESNIEGLLLD